MFAMSTQLLQGDRLPSLKFQLVGGDEMVLPKDMPGRYLALLFFRGAW